MAVFIADSNEEIPKHKKKKDSSVSKSQTKSKHKHIYSKDCLLIEGKEEFKFPCRANYCEICGKIQNVHFFETERLDNGRCRALNSDEIYEKYKDLEQIRIDDIWQKYVPMETESITCQN